MNIPVRWILWHIWWVRLLSSLTRYVVHLAPLLLAAENPSGMAPCPGEFAGQTIHTVVGNRGEGIVWACLTKGSPEVKTDITHTASLYDIYSGQDLEELFGMGKAQQVRLVKSKILSMGPTCGDWSPWEPVVLMGCFQGLTMWSYGAPPVQAARCFLLASQSIEVDTCIRSCPCIVYGWGHVKSARGARCNWMKNAMELQLWNFVVGHDSSSYFPAVRFCPVMGHSYVKSSSKKSIAAIGSELF